MKNIVWISIIGLLFLCYACHEEVMETPFVEPTEVATTFELGICVPEMNTAATRTMVDNIGTKDNPPLWVVVFDGTGYLVEYAKARHFKTTEGETKFKVTLRTTSNKRIVHFLLGYADDLHLKFGHESTVIGSLVGVRNTGVYWQRKVLRNGIDSLIVEQELQRVPLLRNFSKIKVVNRDREDFSLTGFYVLNVPATGTVAPYSGGRFVDFWTGQGLVVKDYAALIAEDYIGALPNDMEYLLNSANKINIHYQEKFMSIKKYLVNFSCL